MATKGSKESQKKSARRKVKPRSSRTTRTGKDGVAKKRVSSQMRSAFMPTKWDYETDVLIVGYGAAGANAAIAAHDAGARALVIEKLGYPGGNSGVCAGAMVIPESLEEAIQYYRALSFGTADEEIVRSFAEEMVGIPRLLTNLGIEFKVRRTEPAYFPSFLTSQVKRIQVSPTGAYGFCLLDEMVRGRKVAVLMDTAATALIQDPRTREVIGAKAKSKGKDVMLLARRGVILSCGGYEYNRGMLSDFHFPGPPGFYQAVCDLVARRECGECDLCVLTGDYAFNRRANPSVVTEMVLGVVARLAPPCGFLAIPGNNDTSHLLKMLQKNGLPMLVNDHAEVERGGETIYVAGVDDPHEYKCASVLDAVCGIPDGAFTVLLAHSPEAAKAGARAGAAVYLCGHTHGGQICLPGSRPVFINTRCPRSRAAGLWRVGEMQAYTTRGLGASTIEVRYACPPDATVVTLRREEEN